MKSVHVKVIGRHFWITEYKENGKIVKREYIKARKYMEKQISFSDCNIQFFSGNFFLRIKQ